MPRPPKPRRICALPEYTAFAPCKTPTGSNACDAIRLSVDEFETIRLIDDIGQTQEECSDRMNVSRTTVQAIYDSARKKIAAALVGGKAIYIEGGAFEMCDYAQNCCHASQCSMNTEEHPCENEHLSCPYCPKRTRTEF